MLFSRSWTLIPSSGRHIPCRLPRRCSQKSTWRLSWSNRCVFDDLVLAVQYYFFVVADWKYRKSHGLSCSSARKIQIKVDSRVISPSIIYLCDISCASPLLT